MANLIIQQPGRPERRIEVPLDGEVVIGRDASCSVAIDEPSVSRRQVLIAYDSANAIHRISDLASRNGSWLNGKRLAAEPRRLSNGDRIHLTRNGIVIHYFADDATVTQKVLLGAGLPLIGPEAVLFESSWRILWRAMPWFKVLAAVFAVVSGLVAIAVGLAELTN